MVFGLTLDMTINFGNVLTGAVTVVSVVGAYYKLRERMVRIETQLEPLWTQFTRDRDARTRAEDR